MNRIETLTSPEKFYYALQGSRFKEDAFEQWDAYRKKVTDLIISSCDKNKTLAILGAGMCNDIDLGRLASHFSQITLIDINDSSMYSGISKYELSQHPKVKVSKKDFVGILDEDYIRYIYALLREYKEYKLYNKKSSFNVRNSKTIKQLDSMYQNAVS